MSKVLFTLCVYFTASQAFAALPDQLTRIEPAAGSDFDHGPYSVQSQVLGTADPDRAIAFDNFSLASDYFVTGIDWVGIYAEPLPAALSDTDFIVQIWGDASGIPDLGGGAIHTFTFEGGPVAGTGGVDLTVTANGDVSSSTSTSVGGGPGFDYSGTISTTTITAGDYWISIIADQRFDNVAPVVDPEWQWHRGTGPDDGFYAADARLDPTGTPAYGVFQPDKDLSFRLNGTLVPEPSGMLLTLFGLIWIGLLRRKRM